MATDRTDMATDRTVMAAERTLMAWVRTSLSMISFGFTIYKVLQGFQSSGQSVPSGASPRAVGLLLIALGTGCMILGTSDYARRLRKMRQRSPVSLWRSVYVVALIMSVLGVLLFVGILSRIV